MRSCGGSARAAQNRIDELVAAFHLDELIDRPVGT
jgi:hypothetical protein